MGDKNSFVLYMDLLSVLDELDDEETAMLFRAIRAYNQLESENEAIRTKAEEDLEAMTANKTVRIAFAPIRKRLEADNKRYAETVQLNKANGKLGARLKVIRTHERRKRIRKPRKQAKTTQTTERLIFQPETTEGLKKQAKTTENNIDMICNDVDMINNNSPSLLSLDGVREKKNINGKETENSKFLTEFFSENKRAQIETICMQLYVTPERLRKEAEEVIDEWELTGDTHINYTEWARHLINHLRIKIRKDNGNNREQKAGATDTTDRHSGICEPATQKKPRRSTL